MFIVNEAELADEEQKVKESIGGYDSLKRFIYNLKNQINEKNMLAEMHKHDEKDKLETSVKKTLMDEGQLDR